MQNAPRRTNIWLSSCLALCAGGLFLFNAPAQLPAEDTVLSTIKEAMKQYEKGDYTAMGYSLTGIGAADLWLALKTGKILTKSM